MTNVVKFSDYGVELIDVCNCVFIFLVNFAFRQSKPVMEMNAEMKRRYARQIVLAEIGVEGQQRLLDGSVAVVGCGALGSMVAMQLAGAGVGRIGICDFDTIDVSNLQRQLFFDTDQCGRSKCGVLAERMKRLNPDITVEPMAMFLTADTARIRLAEFDFIVEATDNAPTKYLVDAVCAEIGRPCCIGGVRRFSGQVATFIPGGVRYADIFPEAADGGVTPCSTGGVIGGAAGVVASVQAVEAIKYIAGAGVPLSGKMMMFNLLSGDFITLPFAT